MVDLHWPDPEDTVQPDQASLVDARTLPDLSSKPEADFPDLCDAIPTELLQPDLLDLSHPDFPNLWDAAPAELLHPDFLDLNAPDLLDSLDADFLAVADAEVPEIPDPDELAESDKSAADLIDDWLDLPENNADVCEPDCWGKQCGDDGCGGSCGDCADADPCSFEMCVDGGCFYYSYLGCCDANDDCEDGNPCTDDICVGEECQYLADDDNQCDVGAPGWPDACVDGECVCLPNCIGKGCGPDGCGGSCGECEGTQEFCEEDVCICQPECEGMECGDDGCGGSCGSCGPAQCCLNFECQDPAVEFLSPTLLQKIQQQIPLTPVTVEFDIGECPAAVAQSLSVQCLLDGSVDGSVQESPYVFANVPFGMHQLCCQLVEGGVPLQSCDALECVYVRIVKPCAGSNDQSCNDSSPLSVDACLSIGAGEFECNYGPAPGNNCVSVYDCDCVGSGLHQQCDQGDSTCH